MLPLRAIRVFDLVAQHESIKRAAEELNLTPGAVGQQIKILEDWLGVALFQRHAKRISITQLGRDYHAQIAPALAQITTASRAIQEKDRNAVTLSIVPSLATRWLVTRLDDFMLKHPEIDIVIESSTRLTDFERDPTDLAIRYFDGAQTGLEAELLYDGHSRVVCSPAYRDRLGLEEPADVQRATLLQTPLHAEWDTWLTLYTDLSPDERQAIRAVQCNEIRVGIDAAKEKLGLVLTTPLLVERELADGSLVELFEARLASPRSYYLVYPSRAGLSKPAGIFRDWMARRFRSARATD